MPPLIFLRDSPSSTSLFLRRSVPCSSPPPLSPCLFPGQAVLVSPEPVSLGQWHRVVAERSKKAGHLRVDHGPVERKTSPGKAQGLNIYTPMYLGGVPDVDLLPKPANISEMFKGCVGEVIASAPGSQLPLCASLAHLTASTPQVSINNKKVDLSYSFTESRSIQKCVDSSPCDRRPCLNGGRCMPNAEYEYQCLCRDGFEGQPISKICFGHIYCTYELTV